MMTVEILATGDELLSGQVVDTNSAWLGDRLWDLGVLLRRKTLVGDHRPDLLAALAETTARADLGATANDWIGRSEFTKDPFFDGAVDEFRIYDRALSPEEIQALVTVS